MAEASHSAGKTGATRVRSKYQAPTFSLWRSVVKTLSPIEASRNKVVGSVSSLILIRTGAKYFLWIWAAGLPAALYARYGYSRDLRRLLEDNTIEGVQHSPTIGTVNPDIRPLPARPDWMGFTADPWKVYAKCYNKVPWEQRTMLDDPDEQRGWDAWGGKRVRSGASTTNQTPNAMYIYEADNQGYSSFWTWWAGNFARNTKLWGQDLYNSYYHMFFNVPLEERMESRTYRRIARRNHADSPGVGGWRLITMSGGGLTPFASVSYA
eukprot:Rhum_TRINITY_DN16865_c0_g1::Rhum_TRINITY_DN16865_c0_g1_i1::g.164669::m.164669